MPVISNASWSEIKGPAVLFVKAEWCGFCQRTKPEIKKAADIMGTVVPIYAVDGDNDKEVLAALRKRKVRIEGFPTILFLHANGKLSTYQESARTGRKIADWACAHSGNCGRSSRA